MIFAASAEQSFAVPVLLLDISLLAILVVVAFAIVRMRSLFGVVMLQGVYSLVSAAWFVSLDAVDVAFTEAAVGAGVSTVLMLSAMLLADRKSTPVPMRRQLGALAVVVVAGAAMLYAVGDMPAFGDVNSPANSYVGMDFIAKTATEVEVPNVVTAVLASYRGYDTFGETVVIFAAGLGVLLLLGLNGNAGRWVARPNGIYIKDRTAPSAALAADNRAPEAEVSIKEIVAPEAKPKPQAKRKFVAKKKPAVKKPTASKPKGEGTS